MACDVTNKEFIAYEARAFEPGELKCGRPFKNHAGKHGCGKGENYFQFTNMDDLTIEQRASMSRSGIQLDCTKCGKTQTAIYVEDATKFLCFPCSMKARRK